MNARIKRKVSKRIMNKVMRNEPLTEFEQKYNRELFNKNAVRRFTEDNLALKHASNTISAMGMSIGEFEAAIKNLSIAINPEMIAATVEKHIANGDNERIDIIDEENIPLKNVKEESVKPFSGVIVQAAKPPVDTLTKQLQEEGLLVPPVEYVLSNAAVEPIKESKWSKAKNKLKGWFGK